MLIARYVKVAGDIDSLPLSIDQLSELLRKHFSYKIEVDVSASAWTSTPSIFIKGNGLPAYIDINQHPEVRVFLQNDGSVKIITNFDIDKDYQEATKCQCGISTTHGENYHWHSYYCPLSRKQ